MKSDSRFLYPPNPKPRGYDLETMVLTFLLVMSFVGLIAWWWYVSYPPKPPPVRSCYEYEPPEPLGPVPPTLEDDWVPVELMVMNWGATETLYGIAIDWIRPEKSVEESAIYVGKGWDCILDTQEFGCAVPWGGMLMWDVDEEALLMYDAKLKEWVKLAREDLK